MQDPIRRQPLRLELPQGVFREALPPDILVRLQIRDLPSRVLEPPQYGQSNPTEKELDDIVARVMQNKDEIKRLTEQLTSNRILTFFKENSSIKTKELSYEKFIKEAYSS